MNLQSYSSESRKSKTGLTGLKSRSQQCFSWGFMNNYCLALSGLQRPPTLLGLWPLFHRQGQQRLVESFSEPGISDSPACLPPPPGSPLAPWVIQDKLVISGQISSSTKSICSLMPSCPVTFRGPSSGHRQVGVSGKHYSAHHITLQHSVLMCLCHLSLPQIPQSSVSFPECP